MYVGVGGEGKEGRGGRGDEDEEVWVWVLGVKFYPKIVLVARVERSY